MFGIENMRYVGMTDTRQSARTTSLTAIRPPGAGALFVSQPTGQLTQFEMELMRQFMLVLQRLEMIERRLDALAGVGHDKPERGRMS